MAAQTEQYQVTQTGHPAAISVATSCKYTLVKGQTRVSDIELRSLAPKYEDAYHKTYVCRLRSAIKDSGNKNIALTGRYGVGKSSILDNFIEVEDSCTEKQRGWWKRRKNSRHEKILRISINTLGPDEGEDITNRIQKELVKQLVYRTSPGELTTSRFARAPKLTRKRAMLDAFGATVALVGLLWLFGLRPDKNSMGTESFLLPMGVLFALVFGVLWAIRWYTGNRVVAQVSAGGATISLEGKDDSYFDKYLDELITFFETTEPEIVVFEDLDRFDDPRIFDSLRELNTLVNSSAHWSGRKDKPLRFIYAIKDSLFEKLGEAQQNKDAAQKSRSDEDSEPVSTKPAKARGDLAIEAMERANRTKFFEIVIPVVPFLSHSNARDHFLKELDRLELPEDTEIDRGLIDIVARHTTDMRLMINIVNEFVVYAEKLLWVNESKRAPGLSVDALFSLVVYKNFHLADFEALPQRGSVLDTLETKRRHLVDAEIKSLLSERTELIRGVTREQKQRDLAAKLGQRLEVFLSVAGMTLITVTAGDVSLDAKKTSDRDFWQQVGRKGSLHMQLQHRRGYRHSPRFEGEELKVLFPEAADPREWLDPSETESDLKRISDIEAEIAELRGASFKTLVENDSYKYDGNTFNKIVEQTLPSELARDLVRRGYIDRFYAEYATVFYGDYLGVDVANFFRNSVWPNEMDTQFTFTTDGAVRNVLEQAPADFLRTRSALNIEIVNHLMDSGAASAKDLIDFLARPNNAEGKQFLRTYFNTPMSRSEKLVSLLAAKPWSELFNFIAAEGAVDDVDMKVALLSAGFLSAEDFKSFELNNSARRLIADQYAEIPAFRDPQTDTSAEILFDFLMDALTKIPNVSSLSHALQKLAVNSKQYELTAGNLRAAVSLNDDEPISADNLIAKEVVWQYCVEHIDDYIALIANDERTTSSCTNSETLVAIINAQHEDWSSEQMEAFLDTAAESAALPDITAVKQATWKTVVEAFLMTLNITNLHAYVTENGVDNALSELLTGDAESVRSIDGLENASEEDLEFLRHRLLNANEVLTPRQRVLLAKQLLAAPDSPKLELSEIEPQPDRLLAELLQADLVPDSEDVFNHFAEAGWSSIGPALEFSPNASTFLVPELIAGHETELICNSEIPASTRSEVLKRLPEFAPSEDTTFLAEAASAARAMSFRLSAEALILVAPKVEEYEDLVWQLREHGNEIAPTVALTILGSMSGKFAGFAETSNHKFEVPDTPSLESILVRLKEAEVLAFQPGRQPSGRWKLRIV